MGAKPAAAFPAACGLLKTCPGAIWFGLEIPSEFPGNCPTCPLPDEAAACCDACVIPPVKEAPALFGAPGKGRITSGGIASGSCANAAWLEPNPTSISPANSAPQNNVPESISPESSTLDTSSLEKTISGSDFFE